MAVIGTPVVSAPPLDTSCGPALITVRPVIKRVYRRDIPGKMRGVAVRRSQQAQIEIVLLDDAGNPVDLAQFGFDDVPDDIHTIVVKVGEATQRGGCLATVDGETVDVATGVVRFPVPCGTIKAPGVYLCEVGALDDNALIFSNTFYLMIERGFFTSGDDGAVGGPPTI